MSHRLIILLLAFGIVTAVVGGVVSWNWPAGPVREDFGPRLTSPATTSPVEELRTATSSVLEALPTPPIGPPPVEGTVGVASANPTIIAVNEATNVTVTIPITDSRLIPGSVNLQRLNATGKVIAVLGTLNDAGTGGDAVAGDKTFTIRRSFTEATTTPVRLRVSWGLKGVLRRAISNSLTVDVWKRVIETTSHISLAVPPQLVAEQDEDSLRFFDSASPGLPPVFVVSSIDVFQPELRALPLALALETIARNHLSSAFIQVVAFHDNGLEVQAMTFAGNHFFLYAGGDKAVEFMANAAFFRSSEFRSMIQLVRL